MKKPLAILFDWDNTLADTWPVIYESLYKTFIAMGHEPWSFEDVKNGKDGIHHSVRDSFPAIFGDRWEEAKDIYLNGFLEIHLQKIKKFPKTDEILEHLSNSDIYTAIVSNKTGAFLREEVEHFGWCENFSKVVGATDAKKDKPYPDMIYLALSESGIDAGEDVWIIGDSETDIRCAINAGCTPVFFGDGAFADNYIYGGEKKYSYIKHIKTHDDLLKIISDF